MKRKLTLHTNNHTGYDAKPICELVRACCRWFSLEGRVALYLTQYNGKYVSFYGQHCGEQHVDTGGRFRRAQYELRIRLPADSYTQRVLVWCVQRSVLQAKGVSRANMTPAQAQFNLWTEPPKWVPERIRLPLVVTDLRELPKSKHRHEDRFESGFGPGSGLVRE